MKKIPQKTIILIAVLLLVSAMVATADTASDSADLILSGHVGSNVTITVSTLAAAGTLDLINGVTGSGVKVATVSWTANVPYTISASSANSGELVDSSQSSLSGIAYNLVWGSDTVAFNTPVADETSGMTSQDIYVTNIAANGSRPAGTYTDTVTFNIVADF